MLQVPSLSPDAGVMLEMVGEGNLTVNAPASTPAFKSTFMTVTSQMPVAAPARSKSQVILVFDTTVTRPASMSGCPALDSFTVAPVRKLSPRRPVM